MFMYRWNWIAPGLGLLLVAYVLHARAGELTRQAIEPPSDGNVPGREDKIFGEDPRVFAERPENQALLAAACQVERLALAAAGGGAIVLLSVLFAGRRGVSREVAAPGGTGTPVGRTEEPFRPPAGPTAGRTAGQP
jgi:hypothetical protein